MMKVEIEDGKYTYGRAEVLRHGEPWRDVVGDKFIYCMASEIEQLRQRVAELEERRCEVCGYAEHHREHIGCLRKQVEKLTAERDYFENQFELAKAAHVEDAEKLIAERDALKQQRDKLLAAAEAIEIDAEECLDFDECTAMLVPIDTYHKLMEAIASVKEKQNET